MAANFILVEPLFYGTVDKGLSGEDFVDRVQALKTAQAWADDVAVGKAASFLRGPAREWFTRGLALQLQDRAAAALFHSTWTVFIQRFKEMYVQVHVLADVGASWGSLRQGHKEGVRDFTQRVASTLAAYGSLCAPTAIEDATIRTLHDLSRAAADVPLREAALAGWAVAFLERDVATVDRLVGSFAIKVIADGLSNEKLRALVRKLEREDKPFYDITRALLNAQVDTASRQLPAAASVSAAGRGPSDNARRRQGSQSAGRSPGSSSGARPRNNPPRRPAPSGRHGSGRDGQDQPRRDHRPTSCSFCSSPLHAREDCAMQVKAAASASRITSAAARAETTAAASDVAASTSSLFEMMDVGDLWMGQGNA